MPKATIILAAAADAPEGAGRTANAQEAPGVTEGELWSRGALDELRARRFSPVAIGRFLNASNARARDVRRARPELARQSRRWMAAGAGAWMLLAAADIPPYRRRLASGLGWWAATGVMLDWHLGMLETEDGRPRPLGPADALTLARAWLVPVIADDLDPRAILAAAATDILDGVAARATEPTRAGRDLEGLVDSAVGLSALAAALRTNRLPRIVGAFEALRITAGIGYSVAVYFGRSREPDPAVTRAARLTTPMRIAGLAAAGDGRRRRGALLLSVGSAASLAALVTGWARPRS